MTPYRPWALFTCLAGALLLCSLVGSPVIAYAGTRARGQAERANGSLDPVTRRGFEYFYSLEYDNAVRQFERAVEARPGDARALNHLLQAEIFRELYRFNALDSTLYARGNSFLDGRELPVDELTKKRIEGLTERALLASEERLKQDPNNVEALYTRGVTRGLKSTYTAMVERKFMPALRSALGSRDDHEKVLKLDPQFTDAKLAVGVHNYIVGSLPFYMRAMTAIVGIGGNKNRGLSMLFEVAAANRETSPDARIALGLFLRREGRYDDALAVLRSLVKEYPRNFLFGLEEANLLKDAGRGPEAIEAYRKLVDDVKAGRYPNPHGELAAYGLAESLRGQRQFQPAVEAYEAALVFPTISPELRQRATLYAGQMYDVLQRRELANSKYKAVVAGGEPNSAMVKAARKYLKKPYQEKDLD